MALFVLPIKLRDICTHFVCNSFNISTHCRSSTSLYTLYSIPFWDVIQNVTEAHGPEASSFIKPVLELIQIIRLAFSVDASHWFYPSSYLAPNTFYTVWWVSIRVHKFFLVHKNGVLIAKCTWMAIGSPTFQKYANVRSNRYVFPKILYSILNDCQYTPILHWLRRSKYQV